MSVQGTSVYDMLNTVLVETREKLAAESSGSVKTAAAKATASAPKLKIAGFKEGDLLKIADACDHLAKNIHLVNDDRSPQEKLAEFSAVHQALMKKAAELTTTQRPFEVGNEAPKEPTLESYSGEGNKGEHQTQEADQDSIPDERVNTDSSGTGVGGSNAIPSMPAMTPGEEVDAGELGEATSEHQSPPSTSPNESPQQFDAANAMETNLEMMMPEQPEAVLKQAAMASPTFQRLVASQPPHPVYVVTAMMKQAAASGIPAGMALHMIRRRFGDDFVKAAEDAIFPAQISSGQEPQLQREPGIPSQLSQGSEAGSNTPRETAPTSGEGGGRELLSSIEAAINATKEQAKAQNKGALAEVLSEPALSSEHDKALEQSLDNTSSAGVKISSAKAASARELLRKFQSSSPSNAMKLASKVKKAQEPGADTTAPAAAAAAPEPAASAGPGPEEVPEEVPEGLGEEEPVISDEAFEAARAGVTPEEVAAAEELLMAQGLMSAQAAGQEAPLTGEPSAPAPMAEGATEPAPGGAPMPIG